MTLTLGSAAFRVQQGRNLPEGLGSDDRTIELSFTGEGAPALNWRQAAAVCQALPGMSSYFNSVRYCFSGLGADRVLAKLDGGPIPTSRSRPGCSSRSMPRERPCATAWFDTARR
ncbi:hypothetical protein LJR290_007675 [Variovorax sp. LjRoot290]|uniref:hypothetical protein n=1 Tax=Variovorax sp. LjRoot290 TaxID=3342316 RepID=UPI003ECC8412